MSNWFKFQGKILEQQDINFIRQLIIENPNDSRRILSKKVCLAWNWRQANGQLKDMFCRSLMLKLHREGHILLPVQKKYPNNPLLNRKHPAVIEIDQSPILRSLSEIKPLDFQQVRATSQEKLYNSLISAYHYLGYCHPIGEHLKYIVFWQRRPIACFGFSSAVRQNRCRDKYIGWTKEIREKKLNQIAYNTRFLILPWVKVNYLASHLLSRISRILPPDWQKYYGHPIYYLETFVDTERFQGSCYQAANWHYLGKTSGRGKNNPGYDQKVSIKSVWGYPLIRNFRDHLARME